MYLIKWTTKDGYRDARFFKTYAQMEKFFMSLFRKKIEAVAAKDTQRIGTIACDRSQVPGSQWKWYLETEGKKMGRPAVKDKKQRVLLFLEKSVIRKNGGMASMKKLLLDHAKSPGKLCTCGCGITQ